MSEELSSRGNRAPHGCERKVKAATGVMSSHLEMVSDVFERKEQQTSAW